MTSIVLWDTEPLKITEDGKKLWWGYGMNMGFEKLASHNLNKSSAPVASDKFFYYCEMPSGERIQVILREDFRNPDSLW